MTQADDADADGEHSSTQPSSRDDCSWPVERVPARLDAERAHRPLDLGFVQSFRHAILSVAAHDVEYLNDTTENIIRASRPRNLDTYYPLTLAKDLPQLPLEPPPRTLLDAFRIKGHPNLPLIHHIPIRSFSSANLPGYLAYAMATIGAMILSESPTATDSLWSTGNTLIASALEVDNREARKADLINAWALLGTYGALCADAESWQQTNTNQGYISTAARRLCNNPTSEADGIVMPAFLLADVLRAVHYGDPLTVSTLECLTQPNQVSLASLSIYKAQVLEHGSLPPEIAESSSLTALVAILADIHTFAHVLYPLSATPDPAVPPTPRSQPSGLGTSYSSYIPFSLPNETRLASRRLHRALELWATAYLPTSPPHTAVLYYFCKMYLALPAMQMLPSLAGYPPSLFRDGFPHEEQRVIIDAELRDAPEAHKYAWQILEYTAFQGLEITSPCLPIAVFYAALVIWRTVLLQLDSGGHGSRKVLLVFKEELNKMCWPCCGVMAATVEILAS
ncbi:hypothetical protein BKA56DRAFT_624130 [Ilyonectria sp. MPI-CAGE-AT-0026]|nr:hypothetical protein BKA56DRAFT_624130 [Ilyonectria sp. MPI-CAGE-AT-0026]